MTHTRIFLALVFGSTLLATPVMAAVGDPVVDFMPVNKAPTPPAGEKIICPPNPNTGAADATCPVVKYNGYSTWAFSYSDNRMAIALVTYDPSGKVVGNLNKSNIRYIWNMVVDSHNRQIEMFGQSNQWIAVTWDELKAAQTK